MIIGDNYGYEDTETGERFGMGGKNGNICNHEYQDGVCVHCGELLKEIEK